MHGVFTQVANVPAIKMLTLKLHSLFYNVFTSFDMAKENDFSQETWDIYKKSSLELNQTVENMSRIAGFII
jgi:exoribonuclease II